MEFHEAATTLFGLRRFGTRPGTEATAALLAHLGNPHERLRCVQVAGTNGKGSTARMVDTVLREAGYSVGLYTSPHLNDVRERVQVDGRPIRTDAVTAFVEQVEGFVTDRAAASDPPTFFETLTGLALWEFDRQDVDVAVLEVGIGGRHDATSVVDPVGGAVTSVSLEHTGVLGEDVPTIARDMAAVAPADRPLVTAATGDALAAVRKTAGDVVTVDSATPDGTADPDVTVDYAGRAGTEGRAHIEAAVGDSTVSTDTRLALLGPHQARNAGVAVALAEQVSAALDGEIPTATLRRGLRNAHWPGRFELFGREPLVALDGAHNPAGCARLGDTLSEFAFDDLHLVVGALTEKDHTAMARALPAADRVTLCAPAHDRAESTAVLERAFRAGTEADLSTRTAVSDALADALDRAGPDDCVLVTGSLYTVAEARARWARTVTPKRTGSPAGARAVLDAANVAGAEADRVQNETVHRVVETRIRPRRARVLDRELRALGGTCAFADISDGDEERLTVVLSGTLAQFRQLCVALDDRPGLATVADDIRRSVGLETTTGAETGGYPWEEGTAVMGILNVTPDSFHDGGEFADEPDAVARAEAMVAAGADIVDVGGESTRPGADPVPVPEETARVLPVVERLADLDALVSVDTRKAPVARAALDAGADILNDVSGLADPEMRLVAADYDVPVVVMHSIETPVDPDSDIAYDDVVDDVLDVLGERVLLAERAGLDRSQIIVDPGVGFGKSAAESFELLARLDEFRALGCPILVGHSHKSLFAQVDRGPDERRDATVATTALAARRGADIVRVHDVDPNVAAVDVADTLEDADRG